MHPDSLIPNLWESRRFKSGGNRLSNVRRPRARRPLRSGICVRPNKLVRFAPGLQQGRLNWRGDDIGGIAVSCCRARFMGTMCAERGWVSRVVTELLVPARAVFAKRASHEAQGSPGALGPVRRRHLVQFPLLAQTGG